MALKVRLKYEEVLGYHSNLNYTRRGIFLGKSDWGTLLISKLALFFFFAYKISLLMVFLASEVLLNAWWFPLSFLLVGLCFMCMVDKELVNLAIRREMTKSSNTQFQKLISIEADGWYDDPWANGKVGHKRLWKNGMWTKETQIPSSAKSAFLKN